MTYDKYRLGFRPGLDGLRGLAILSVLGVHATYLWSPLEAAKFIPGAFVSVDVFFALSGFLITSLLLSEINRTGRLSLRGFYRRRALRLLPVLYTMLIAQFIYTIIVGDPLLNTFKGSLLIAFYVSNWAQVAHLPQPFGTQQTWSLGVEEQFYLLWPLLLIGITKLMGRRRQILPFAVLIGVALFCRALLWHLNVPYYSIYVQTEVRLDVLMAGSLAAYLMHTGWRPGVWSNRVGYLSLLFLIYLVAFVPVDSAWLYHLGGFTLVAFAAAAVVLVSLADQTWFGKLLATPLMQAIGRRSYSLYITHYLIYLAVVRAWWPSHTGIERLALGLGLTAVATEIVHRAVERPFLTLKDRPRRKNLSADPTSTLSKGASIPPQKP